MQHDGPAPIIGAGPSCMPCVVVPPIGHGDERTGPRMRG